MGTTTQARCRACGYDSDTLFVGGGMREGDLYWPVMCNKCEAVTTANFERPRLQCRDCRTSRVIPMSDPKLWKRDGAVVEEWGVLKREHFVTDGHYRCPKCGEFELAFGEPDMLVMWD